MVKCGKKWALSKGFDSSNHDRGVGGVSNITMSVVRSDGCSVSKLEMWLWLRFSALSISRSQCGT